ncbi:LuxR C-terminal-related transcriptional regulator [Streptomyces sp. NBC_01244]|uniref:LuxR C-terminal-related transcriptional regulator n=1 Tax=Streptomyces sp. NBC_01244 TaxID=2903797 RepID=UPI002E0E7997|nr:LuxR C-terminal-related transcriptional regulator [Streptomyces sp. NBC_01244]
MVGPDLASRWPLVGRDAEVAAFDRAWSSSGLQAVMVWGPAGVGKSRLADACLDRAVAAGFTAGRATATAAAAAVPLAAIAHLIPAGVDMRDPVAGFAQIAGSLAGARPAGAGSGGRVLLVDDLHLLDGASAVLLRQLMDANLVRLIGTIRTGGPMSDAVAALSKGDMVHRIDLSVFDTGQIAEVLEAVLGGPVAGRAVHRLGTASNGNALYLRELMLGAVQDGVLAFDGEIWHLSEERSVATQALAHLVEARFAAAPETARPALELLALCEPLSLEDVQAETGPGELAHLEAVDLISVTAERHRTTVRLAHPLYGEVLRAVVPTLRRRHLLEAQIRRAQDRGEGWQGDPRRIVEWQLAASGSADPGQLVQAALLARYARDYAQVEALLEAVPDEAHTARSRLMLIEALLELGRPRDTDQVLAAAEADVRSERQALAVLLIRANGMALSDDPVLDPAGYIDALSPHISSHAGRTALRHCEGAMYVFAGDVPRALRLTDGMDGSLDGSPNPLLTMFAAVMRGHALIQAGRGEEALALGARLRAEFHQITDESLPMTMGATVENILAIALCTEGRLADAREVAQTAYAEVNRAAIPVVRCFLAWNLGSIAWLSGRPAEARRWYAETAALSKTYDIRMIRPAMRGLAAAAALLGDVATAERAVGESGEHHHLFGAGWDALGVAWLCVARGDLSGARRVLAEAAERTRAAGLAPFEALVLTDIARLGAPGDVAARLAELAESCDGPLVAAQARLAAALHAGDPDLLLASADELHALAMDLMAAEAAAAAAAALRRGGEARRATAAAQQSAGLARTCEGARTPLLAAAKTPAQLTPRQRDIAHLAAKGTTSKQIAESLHLSTRTVDNHLQTIYTKLGVSTRRELAALLQEHGDE